MCSADESQQVIKFKDYILILPSIKNLHQKNKYLLSLLKKKENLLKIHLNTLVKIFFMFMSYKKIKDI